MRELVIVAVLLQTFVALGQDSIELGQATTGNKNTFIDFRSDDTYTDYGLRIWRTSAGPNADSMFIHRGQGGLNLMLLDNAGSINMSNASTTFLTIRGDNGNVGVGTTNPSAKLDVKGHVVFDAMMGSGWGGPVLWLSSAATDQSRYLLIANSPNTSMASGIKAGGILCADAFNYANPDKNTLIVKGLIGVGTTNPQEKLHVEGNGRFKGRIVALHPSAEATGNAPTADLHLQGTGSTTELVLHSTRSAAQGSSESKISFKTGYWCSNGAQIAGIKDASNDLVKIVFRTIDGQYTLQDRVTIGPSGNMAVQGVLSAQEVKVTASGFPDYVFDPAYELKSLEEIATHIKEHRRLPGIPSTSEVDKNGLALSEMSKKQMEKIEELTLYLIEMKKQNDELRKRVELLERK